MSRSRTAPDAGAPHLVEFHRTKYGPELLIDAAFVHSMPTFLKTPSPHALGFHDILLVTRGRGSFVLDGDRQRVAPGVVFFSRPGEVRRWEVKDLDGACLFFTEEFVAEAFSDARFLHRFAYFRAERPTCALRLPPPERRRFLDRFRVMQDEIAALRDDASHALRAVLYETLVLLNRAYVARHGPAPEAPLRAGVEGFQRLVERDFSRRHRVADYAAELGVSPGHLNVLCRSGLRRTAGAVIRLRLTLEAKRLLAFGDLTAAQIAERLGFDDPAYFSRFFRRETGMPPTLFRRSSSRRTSSGPRRVRRRSPARRDGRR